MVYCEGGWHTTLRDPLLRLATDQPETLPRPRRLRLDRTSFFLTTNEKCVSRADQIAERLQTATVCGEPPARARVERVVYLRP